MTIYVTSNLTALVITITICAILFIGGFIIYDKYYTTFFGEIVAPVVSGISGVVGGIAILFLAIFIIGSACQRNVESINYQKNIELQETLQQAIDTTKDVVNTDLYLKAIDFNSDLAAIQTAYNDPRYSISFSGEVDWNTISRIDLE